jgi:DNA (cytosine-5)-methyltransferase 1
MDKRSLLEVPSTDIPDAEGIIGGPPCQSWSLAGAMRGAKDSRGQLFFEYVRVIKDKHPAFFLAENVPGILSPAHVGEFNNIVSLLKGLGYRISYKTIDSRDYGVPQERKRVIIVGYDEGLGKKFEFPTPSHSRQSVFSLDGGFRSKWVTLRQAIGDMPKAVQSGPKNKPNSKALLPNHEYMTGGFSTIYMSRNRKKSWDQQSFTIQAGGRHAPLHPSSCEMRKVQEDEWVFVSKKKSAHRRMSIRECARIQTFPDDFVFYYDRVSDGYKMVGNAVPVALAKALAAKIKSDLAELLSAKGDSLKPGILA